MSTTSPRTSGPSPPSWPSRSRTPTTTEGPSRDELEPLRHLVSEDGGREWLERLPAVVGQCAASWRLDLGPMFPSSNVSFVAPATDAAGRPVVLKIQYPHRESEGEADALRCWAGDGAVELLDDDPARRALLIERCVPGEHLSTRPEDALDVLVGLLPRLWKPARPPFDTLEREASRWERSLERNWDQAGRPYERRLLDAALDALHELPRTQGEQVVVHQDLHADNVLSATREAWLVIDPKPLLGERAFGVAPIVRSYELGHDRRAARRRLDRVTGEFGLDRDRVRGWVVAQTLAWACSGGLLHEPHHLDTVRWLLD